MDHESRHRGFLLRFNPLVDGGRGCAFPCNAAGRVDLDTLDERARIDYLYARAVVGREFSVPTVEAQCVC
jgi:hypothetical protein